MYFWLISAVLAAAGTPSWGQALAPSTGTFTGASLDAPQEAAPTPQASTPGPWVIGEIAISGNKNLTYNVIRSHIKARKGSLYDRAELDHDIQTLLGLGSFERVAADISTLDKPVPEPYRKTAGTDRLIKLSLLVQEKPLVRKIKFEGNKKLSRGTLMDIVSMKQKDPFDGLKLQEDQEKILKKYREKGFLDAAVQYRVDKDTEALKADVTFIVQEGAKSRIFWVALKGVKSFKEKKILKLMKNRRKKVFVEADLKEDSGKIETFYRNNGFLDVSVSSPSVLMSEDQTRIYIDISIDEGRSYRFGDTSFSGNLIYTSTELAKAVEYKRGRIFSQEKYEATIRSIQELYAEKGRLRAHISPTKTHNPATDLMDVRYDVSEGNIVYIGHVDLEGNKATKKYVLKREVVVKSGQPFAVSRIRKSVEKLRNLGFIDDVDLDIQNTPDPDKVDVTFDVVEGKPGVLTAGAAYSSVDGLIGTLSLQHLNLFGRAQRASVQWSFGRRVQDYSISWTTPWIYNKPMSLGFDLFNTRRISPFSSSLSGFVEKDRGGTIRLGPRFEEDKYQLNLSYTYSEITITNVEEQFRGQLGEGTSVFSSAGVEFARDTRDNIWDPTKGSRNAVGVQLSGGPFGGDIHLFKPSISNSIYYHLFSIEDYPFVLSFGNRAGYVTQFGGTKDVPVFSRYFLGGQDTLRGYAPTGEVGFPSGGKVFDVFNIEFGFPLARERKKTIVKFVTFFDMGTAWDNVRAVRLRLGTGESDLKTNVGFGIRFTTPAFPIRLDWGYGFNHRPGEKLYQINFGLGNIL
ncbi:MAG: outer membrane protein assembly factor BamA [Elusimicrobia bacterium]|nr:outer membrane protein assembly factor BamA [Elusimicrobiota bacterium]